VLEGYGRLDGGLGWGRLLCRLGGDLGDYHRYPRWVGLGVILTGVVYTGPYEVPGLTLVVDNATAA
jgi:hypothetical protein